MKQIGSIGGYLTTSSTLLDTVFEYGILGATLLIIVNSAIRYFMKNRINIILSEFDTAKSRYEFAQSLKEDRKDFSEQDLVEFVEERISKFVVLKKLSKSIFYMNYDLIVDLCKDKLLSNLIRYEIASYTQTSIGLHQFRLSSSNYWSSKESKQRIEDLFAL